MEVLPSFTKVCETTIPDDDDRKNAIWVLGNLVHYFAGRSSYKDDIETLATALAASYQEGRR